MCNGVRPYDMLAAQHVPKKKDHKRIPARTVARIVREKTASGIFCVSFYVKLSREV